MDKRGPSSASLTTSILAFVRDSLRGEDRALRGLWDTYWAAGNHTAAWAVFSARHCINRALHDLQRCDHEPPGAAVTLGGWHDDLHNPGFGIIGNRGLVVDAPPPEMLPQDMIVKLEAGRCPDCAVADLVLGPVGGHARNIACRGCGSEFNVTEYGGVVVIGHRNSEPGKPNHQRLKEVFGIVLNEPEAGDGR
jgi:hypothetical protein